MDCSDESCVALTLPTDNITTTYLYAETNEDCVDGTFKPEFHPVDRDCVVVNITAYTGIFGSAFERRMFAVSNVGAYESYIVFGVGCVVIFVAIIVGLKRRHEYNRKLVSTPKGTAITADNSES